MHFLTPELLVGEKNKGACDVYFFICGTENNTTQLPSSSSLSHKTKHFSQGKEKS